MFIEHLTDMNTINSHNTPVRYRLAKTLPKVTYLEEKELECDCSESGSRVHAFNNDTAGFSTATLNCAR